MADLFTDSFTGSNGASWSASWTTSGITSLSTTGSSATIQGNKGRLNSGTVASYGGKKAMRYSGTNVSDAEWIGKFTLTTSIDGSFETWIRAATGAVDGTGYVFHANLGTTNNISIIRANAYTYTTLQQASFTISQNTEYNFRFYVVGTSIKAKIWTGTEPGTYNLSSTDSAVTAAGYSYVSANGGGSAGFIVDLEDIKLTDGTSNQFTYTGTFGAGIQGTFKRDLVTKNPFTGTLGSGLAGTFTKLKVVSRIYTGTFSSTLAGVFTKTPLKSLAGTIGSGLQGALIKSVPKTITGSITASPGTLRKSFVRIFSGSVTATGEAIAAFAGRVFGRPGIVKIVVEKAGEVRTRIRRG